jgi:hypothetical protein
LVINEQLLLSNSELVTSNEQLRGAHADNQVQAH